MGSKTVWVECCLNNTLSCYFPGHNQFHAQARAERFFEALSIPLHEVHIKEYTPRKKIITPRKHKKLRRKHILAIS